MNAHRLGRLVFSRGLLLSALVLAPKSDVVAETAGSPPGLVAGVISESKLPDSLLQHFQSRRIVLRREVAYGGQKTEWIVENADLGPRCEAVTSFLRFPSRTEVEAMRHHLTMINAASVLNEHARLAMFHPHARGKTSDPLACQEWFVKGGAIANRLVDAFKAYHPADGDE